MDKIFSIKYGNARLKNEKYLDLNIYRYIDLLSFFDIVLKKKFPIAEKRTFSDYFESREYNSLNYLKSCFVPIGETDIKPYDMMWKCREMNIDALQNTLVSCWTTKKDDNYLRWATYKKAPITIRIGTTVKKLLDVFFDSNQHLSIYASKVEYSNKTLSDPDYASLFCKSASYILEEEFRFCIIKSGVELKNKSMSFLNLSSVEWIDNIMIGTLINRDLAVGFYGLFHDLPFFSGKTELSSIHEKM